MGSSTWRIFPCCAEVNCFQQAWLLAPSDFVSHTAPLLVFVELVSNADVVVRSIPTARVMETLCKNPPLPLSLPSRPLLLGFIYFPFRFLCLFRLFGSCLPILPVSFFPPFSLLLSLPVSLSFISKLFPERADSCRGVAFRESCSPVAVPPPGLEKINPTN